MRLKLYILHEKKRIHEREYVFYEFYHLADRVFDYIKEYKNDLDFYTNANNANARYNPKKDGYLLCFSVKDIFDTFCMDYLPLEHKYNHLCYDRIIGNNMYIYKIVTTMLLNNLCYFK